MVIMICCKIYLSIENIFFFSLKMHQFMEGIEKELISIYVLIFIVN